MTNATNFETNSAYQVPVTEILTPDGENQVDLAHKPIAGTISIAGLEETAQTVVSGRFKVVDGEITKIQFFAGDIADTVTVSYFYAAEAQEANIDNRSSAMGEAIMVYPVYGNGDDCTDSSIIGKVYVRVYKCRVTAQPGFDASYKGANTFQFTLAAINNICGNAA